MSLYSVLMEPKSTNFYLLNYLGFDVMDAGSFVDAYLVCMPEGQFRIVVVTGNGGDNKPACSSAIAKLRSHVAFLSDSEDLLDIPYMSFVFSAPKNNDDVLSNAYSVECSILGPDAEMDTMKRFKSKLKELKYEFPSKDQ